MELTERISALVAPSLEAMGYDIVRVMMTGGRSRPTLQIMAERRDEAAMTVDDCEAISRAVSALLDVEDPISGAYRLEVSSPGIDRPLTRLKDFARFAGFEARVETKLPVGNRRRFKGVLHGVEGDMVKLEAEDVGAVALPFAGIDKAKLVLTDALIAASQVAGGGNGVEGGTVDFDDED